MYIEKEKFINSFGEFEKILKGYTLPLWDALPEIELYMDQVISLLEKYLEIYPRALGKDKFITPAMINNYVKLGIIPAPEKKRYSKKHIALLLIIFTLKQTHDMATIQKILLSNTDEQFIKKTYDSFVKNQQKAFSYVVENIKVVANPIFENEADNPERLCDLLVQAAASANIFKILTDSMSRACHSDFEQN